MKFKCLISGLIYEYTLPVDIASMKQHPEYEEVVEDEPVKEPKTKQSKDIKE